MSESVPPPIPPPHQNLPPQAPPPSGYPGWNAPPPKPRSAWPIIAIIALVFVIGGGIVVGIGVWATKQASKTITVPPNAGKPQVVRELQDGWVESRFAEFPLTVELPGEAESLPFKSEDLGPEFKIIADHFVSYSASGEDANAYLFGYWMNLIGMATISDSEIRAFATEFSAEEGTTKIIELPGVPREVLATYYFSKQEGVDTHTVNLFRRFEHGLLVVSIAALTESAARETGMRIGKTIRL